MAASSCLSMIFVAQLSTISLPGPNIVSSSHEVRDQLSRDEEARPVVPSGPRNLGDVIHGHREVGLARARSLLHERPSLVDDHRLPPAVVLRPLDQAPDGREGEKHGRVPQLGVLDVVQNEDHLVVEGGLSLEEELVGRKAGFELLPQALGHDGIELLDVRDLPRRQVELVQVLPFGKVEDVADELGRKVAIAEDAEGVQARARLGVEPVDVALRDARERILVGPVRADRVLGGDYAVERVEHHVLVEEGHPRHQRLHQRGLAQPGRAHHGYVVVVLLEDVVEDGVLGLQVLAEEDP